MVIKSLLALTRRLTLKAKTEAEMRQAPEFYRPLYAACNTLFLPLHNGLLHPGVLRRDVCLITQKACGEGVKLNFY
jgi:hypothetical protein